MKFALLIYDDRNAWSNMSAEEAKRHRDGHRRFREAAGPAVLATHELAPAADASTIRSRNDAHPRVTEGPYTPGIDELGGYYVIDVPKRDEAIRLASLLPETTANHRAGIEIRPIPD